MPKAIFFDAAGTLIYLPKSVGEHYREIASRFGAEIDARKLDAAFNVAWRESPARSNGQGPREDDDKGWWRSLVMRVLDQTLSREQAEVFDKTRYFEALYAHFATPGVWAAYDDVRPTLEALRAQGLLLGVISNFDRRLLTVLEGLGLRGFFDAVTISSEVGADKPDPVIFQTAMATLHVTAAESLHVGDDPKKDGGAEAVGLRVFRLERPQHSLEDVIGALNPAELA